MAAILAHVESVRERVNKNSNQTKFKEEVNPSVHVNTSVHVNPVVTGNVNPVVTANVNPVVPTVTSSKELVIGTRREEASPSVAVATPFPSSLHVIEAFDAYNVLAQDVGLPTATSMTPSRRRSILARLREHGPEGWQKLITNIERSAFLQGQNDRGWVPPGLDWFLKPANFTKVVEGAYGNGAHAPPRKETEFERMDRLMRGEINFETGEVVS